MADPDWPAEARSRHVEVEGHDLHYLEFDGPAGAPTVVCVHGLGGSALNFGALGPLVSPRHRFLVLDLPGHGLSSVGAAPTRGGGSVDWLVGVVQQFLPQVADEPVALVGHSLGGVVAVLVAQRSPASVDRLVLIAPPGPRRSRLPWDLRLLAKLGLLHAPGVRALVDRQLTRSSADELVDKQLRDATPHLTRVPPEAVAAAVRETDLRVARPDAAAARRLQWNAILATMALLGRSRDWASRLASVSQPTLWLQGRDDLLVPIDDAAALAASRPDWTFRTREDVGHLPHLEDAAWVADTLIAWLSATDGQGPTHSAP
jgi:pimeloyl-ACP methyl ester carboxylesterase